MDESSRNWLWTEKAECWDPPTLRGWVEEEGPAKVHRRSSRRGDPEGVSQRPSHWKYISAHLKMQRKQQKQNHFLQISITEFESLIYTSAIIVPLCIQETYSINKELWIDNRIMTTPAADNTAFSLASEIHLGILRSKNDKLHEATLPWRGALGEFSLYLPNVDTPHRDCSWLNVYVYIWTYCSGAFYFQNHFKMHSSLLWIFAWKFKVYYRIFSELRKTPFSVPLIAW